MRTKIRVTRQVYSVLAASGPILNSRPWTRSPHRWPIPAIARFVTYPYRKEEAQIKRRSKSCISLGFRNHGDWTQKDVEGGAHSHTSLFMLLWYVWRETFNVKDDAEEGSTHLTSQNCLFWHLFSIVIHAKFIRLASVIQQRIISFIPMQFHWVSQFTIWVSLFLQNET